MLVFVFLSLFVLGYFKLTKILLTLLLVNRLAKAKLYRARQGSSYQYARAYLTKSKVREKESKVKVKTPVTTLKKEQFASILATVLTFLMHIL